MAIAKPSLNASRLKSSHSCCPPAECQPRVIDFQPSLHSIPIPSPHTIQSPHPIQTAQVISKIEKPHHSKPRTCMTQPPAYPRVSGANDSAALGWSKPERVGLRDVNTRRWSGWYWWITARNLRLHMGQVTFKLYV
jgi:hypothetical protein